MAENIHCIIIRNSKTNEIVFAATKRLDAIDRFIRRNGKKYPFPEYSMDLLPAYKSMEAALNPMNIPHQSSHGFIPWRDFAVKPIKRKSRVDVPLMTDDNIIEFVINNGPRIFIVAGEFNCRVYTKRFAKALEGWLDLAKEMESSGGIRAGITIVCGPIVMIDGKAGKRPWEGTVLSDLAGRPDVTIHVSRRRQKYHYRLGDYAVYYETPHAPHVLSRTSHEVYFDWDVIRRYRKKRDTLLTDDRKIHPCSDIKSDFVFLTELELCEMSRRIKQRRLDMDQMTIEELKPYIEMVKQ